MKYYKLIDDNQIVGVISSNNFIRYSPIVDCFLRSSEEKGEYISFENKLYRTTWMSPIQVAQDYTLVTTVEISENEYDIYMEAYRNNETIEEPEEEIPTPDPVPSEESDEFVEYIRDAKVREMSTTCRRVIEAGIDLELRGATHHFSLDTQDQLNLISLSAMAQTQTLIPYHADGESCVFYTNEEINEIVESATAFKIYHTTYYNALKGYINSLTDINTIAEVYYGIPIPEEYKSDVLRALEV